MRKTTLVVLWLAWLWLGAGGPLTQAYGATSAVQQPANPRARLAIIPLRTELEPAADLLTASLSTRKNVELLERQQIKKVLAELALGTAQAPNRLKLGAMLSADGLLFLDRAAKGGSEFLTLKLVAVKPGVVITRSEAPWPLPEPDKWAVFAAEQQAALIPKLFVRKEDAIPVSLLSLRSSVITPDTMALDRQLADMLARSLSSQPKIFVLERQRLERLAYEKDWQATNEAFWNGAMVIEGVVNPEAVTAEVVKIKARLTPSRGTSVEAVVEGQRQQLAELVNLLTEKVVQVLQSNLETNSWDPKAEALQYFEEGRWQLRWGFAAEAQQAAESAWALGLRTPEAAVLRVEAYSRFLIDYFFLPTHVFPEHKTTQEHIYYCRRALENYLEMSNASATNALPSDWVKQGENLLRLAAIQLNHVDLAGERDGISRDDLRPAREKIRLLVKFLETQQPLPVNPKIEDGKLTAPSAYGSILMNFGGLWEESYREGLRNFERGVRAGFYLPLLGKNDGCALRIAIWNKENPLICDEQWDAMLVRLQGDPDKLVCLSGCLMKMKTAQSHYAYEAAYLETWQFLKQNVDTFVAGEMPAEVMSWLLQPQDSSYGNPVAARMRDQLIPAYKKDFDEWALKIKLVQEQKEHAAASLLQEMEFQKVLSRVQQATATKSKIEPNEFFHLKLTLNAAQAEKLLEAVLSYEALDKNNFASTLRLRGAIGETYRKIGKPAPPLVILKPPARPPPQPAASPTEPSAIRPVDPKMIPRAPAVIVKNEPIELALPPPVDLVVNLPEGVKSEGYGWKRWILMDGQFWVEAWNSYCETISSNTGSTNRHFTIRSLFSIDLAPPHTLVAHWSATEPRQFTTGRTYGLQTFLPDDGTLVLHQGRPYRVAASKVWQEVAIGSWKAMPWDLPSSIRLSVVNDRLFANTPESILELFPDSGSMKVMASSRQKPPKTLLDELPGLHQTMLFPGANGSVRASIGTEVYQLAPDGTTWQKLASLPPRAVKNVNSSGLIFQNLSHDFIGAFSGFLKEESQAVKLLPPVSARIPSMSRYPSPDEGRWRWPKDTYTVIRTIVSALDGANLWILHGPPSSYNNASAVLDPTFRLLRYSASDGLPLAFKLDFSAPELKRSRNGMDMGGQSAGGAPVELLVDESHLVFVMPDQSRAIFLPKSTMTPYVNQWMADLHNQTSARRTFLEKRKKCGRRCTIKMAMENWSLRRRVR